MSLDQTSLSPLVSIVVGPVSCPGPLNASRRLTVPQPLRASGTCTILPAFGFVTAAPVGPLIVAFWRPVVSIVESACSLVMYGNRDMIKPSTAAEWGPAIEVPDAAMYVAAVGSAGLAGMSIHVELMVRLGA